MASLLHSPQITLNPYDIKAGAHVLPKKSNSVDINTAGSVECSGIILSCQVVKEWKIKRLSKGLSSIQGILDCTVDVYTEFCLLMLFIKSATRQTLKVK